MFLCCGKKQKKGQVGPDSKRPRSQALEDGGDENNMIISNIQNSKLE